MYILKTLLARILSIQNAVFRHLPSLKAVMDGQIGIIGTHTVGMRPYTRRLNLCQMQMHVVTTAPLVDRRIFIVSGRTMDIPVQMIAVADADSVPTLLKGGRVDYQFEPIDAVATILCLQRVPIDSLPIEHPPMEVIPLVIT